MREIADILKIIKSNVENHLHPFGYVHHFDVWVAHEWKKKTFLTVFLHPILNEKQKHSIFKTNCKQLKVDTV